VTAPTIAGNAVSAALRTLGPTCLDVSEKLTRAGVKGVRGSVTNNPVVNWLNREVALRGVSVVAAGPTGISLFSTSWTATFHVPVTTGVGEFLVAFDRGAFSGFVESRTPADVVPSWPQRSKPRVGADDRRWRR
jgi:hypothetical protein